MRHLEPDFLKDLESGILSPLLKEIKADADLDIQIRDNYINVYYKGYSLAKISPSKNGYEILAHQKINPSQRIQVVTADDMRSYIGTIPTIKASILHLQKHSLEIEFEQLLIRANNYIEKNNSEFFVVDRQYQDKQNRFDLSGIFWPSIGRRGNGSVRASVIEVKYGLNKDIALLHKQVQRYYDAIDKSPTFFEEIQALLRQKLDLGLIRGTDERIHAMKSLKVINDIHSLVILIVLIDYNPHSKLLNLGALKKLPFANQVRILKTGMAIWEESLERL